MTQPPADSGPWTLARVERDFPDLAPLARLHGAVEDAFRAAERECGHVHPNLAGTPGVHWLLGRPLLDVVERRGLVERLPDLVVRAARAAASAAPGTAPLLEETLASDAFRTLAWDVALASFRDPQWAPGTPHPTLLRFLFLRAVSVPARHLARSFSAPHPDRWKRSRCPFCGVEAAASVARTGSGRTLLCVLCGGRWESPETVCTGCGERNLSKFRIFANRAAGPGSIESCETCGTAVKVFSSADLDWGPPLALEVATVRLDLLAERDEGTFRDAIALAALFPPG